MKAKGYKEPTETLFKLSQMKAQILFYSHQFITPCTAFPRGNDNRITTVEKSLHFCLCNLFDIWRTLSQYKIRHFISQLCLLRQFIFELWSSLLHQNICSCWIGLHLNLHLNFPGVLKQYRQKWTEMSFGVKQPICNRCSWELSLSNILPPANLHTWNINILLVCTKTRGNHTNVFFHVVTHT